MRSWIRIVATVLVLTAYPVFAADPDELKTDRDRVNYGIGVNIIGNIKQQGVDVDLDLVIRGMRDAYAGKDLLLNEEQLRTAIDQYQTAVRQRRSQMVSRAAEENRKAGEAYLTENAKREGVVTLPNGLQFKVIQAGNGKVPGAGDTVECHYRASLVSGTEFDSTYRNGLPANFKVASAIPGLREALTRMPVGSTWQIFIPAELAYGMRGKGASVGPNAALIFEVALLDIK